MRPKENSILFSLMLTSLQAFGQVPPTVVVENGKNGSPTADVISEIYLPPSRIVWTTDPGKGLVSNAEALLSDENAVNVKPAILQSKGDTGGSLLLDFGCELHGGLRISVKGSNLKTASVRVRFGESVGECNSETAKSQALGFSTNECSIRDSQEQLSPNSDTQFGATGFRFVRIDMLTPNAKVEIKRISAKLRYRNIPYQGSFRCSDERLNRIWLTGAYTTHLCMQEYIWDGVKRDRAVWVGDMYPEVASIACTFGANPVVEKTLAYAKSRWASGWMNNMSAYSAWYLIIMHQWYMYTGNAKMLRDHASLIKGTVSRMSRNIYSNGNETLSSDRFLSWSAKENPSDGDAGYRALLAWALSKAEQLGQYMDDEALTTEAANARQRLNTVVQRPQSLKEAFAMLSLAETIDANEAADAIARDGGKGYSAFLGYCTLQALSRAGRYDEAINTINEFWGAMIDRGATTFWEEFNTDWLNGTGRIDEMPVAGQADIHGSTGRHSDTGFRKSLCHGWSSGPTPWLTHHVLGIEILEPGCTKIAVRPHLGHLSWAEGTFPTPLGLVTVSVRKDERGTYDLHAEGPNGVTIITDATTSTAVEAPSIAFYMEGRTLHVEGATTPITVFNINGQLVYKGTDSTITLPAAGIYIVHVGATSKKIAVA